MKKAATLRFLWSFARNERTWFFFLGRKVSNSSIFRWVLCAFNRCEMNISKHLQRRKPAAKNGTAGTQIRTRIRSIFLPLGFGIYKHWNCFDPRGQWTVLNERWSNHVLLPSSIMFGFRIHGTITGKIFKVFIFLPNEPCMSLPSAVESGWILGKHTRQLHESHSRNTKTSKGRVPCYITKDGTIEGHFFVGRGWKGFGSSWFVFQVFQAIGSTRSDRKCQSNALCRQAAWKSLQIFRTIVKSEVFPHFRPSTKGRGAELYPIDIGTIVPCPVPCPKLRSSLPLLVLAFSL